MDWLKLFAFLVAVASVRITAEGPKKKIRIHLPQKVKHIHHHKKIYITNHPASSQYAPAYLPGVKGAVALPSNVARPAVASLVPFSSVEVFEGPRTRQPAASKLLPLYRARGHYGPRHAEWDEQEYDLDPSQESTDVYGPSYSGSSAPAVSSNNPPKRVKIVKVNEPPRKKVIRKVKPKRVYVRGRTQPHPQPHPPTEDEHPVSSFHEQFYSDLEEAGTIKKIRKPPRIEKIIDGDTEHIHTYSEEHIHKVVFDDDPKVTGVVGVDSIGSMSALTAAHPLIPIKNSQTLVAIPSDSIADFTVVGSMGTPSHLEYSAYNPRDVTHDHIFHDHGELPSNIEVTKETLRSPPKVSYDSHGLRIIGDSSKRHRGKPRISYSKPTNPTPDFSYYESIYTPKHKTNKVLKPTFSKPLYDTSSQLNDYRPIPALRFKDKRKSKTHNGIPNYGGKQVIPNFQLEQASVPAPFSVSSTVVHNYEPKNYAGVGSAPAGFSKFKDSLVDFKDSYSNDFDYDTFASSSNVYTSEDKNDSGSSVQGKTGQKSISTQNIIFGGQDHQTYVDHFAASSNSEVSISDGLPTAAEHMENFDQTTVAATPTPYTIKETSPAHPYYAAMALKALHGDQAEASNDHLHYAKPPTPSTMPSESPLATTTSQPPQYFNIQSTDAILQEDFISKSRQGKRHGEKNIPSNSEPRQRYTVFKEFVSSGGAERPSNNKYAHLQTTDSSIVRGNPKYGDKI